MSNQSLVSFLRRELKVKGLSEHAGRGSYMMYADDGMPYDKFQPLVESLLPKWKKNGIVEEVTMEEEGGVKYHKVKFTANKFDPNYRTLSYNSSMPIPNQHMCNVTFSCSS